MKLLKASEQQLVPLAPSSGLILGARASESVPESPAQKIDLFLKLWESKAGKKGYSPACNNEWVPGVCGKPPKGKVKCTECPNQAFPALDAVAVDRH